MSQSQPNPNPNPRELPREMFRRMDESPDTDFYVQPRFVAHIEPSTIAGVTQLYRERLPAGGAVLDLMSSWVSHLPDEMQFCQVAGLGLNAAELAANPRLTEHVVQSLNQNPRLPYADARFEAAVCCVSVQYLTRPVEVMRDLARVCRSGAPLVITFSNRCFPSKAVAAWQMMDDAGHLELVARYLEDAGDWTGIEKLNRTPRGASEPLMAVVARRV